jgi:hypothetical protein
MGGVEPTISPSSFFFSFVRFDKWNFGYVFKERTERTRSKNYKKLRKKKKKDLF